MEENREKVWDILKGFTICCVLIGHLIQYMSLGELDYTQNYLYLLIYSFHMPLFMFISGYFFKRSVQKYSFKNLMIRQAKGLLIPLFIWNTIFYYFWYVIHMVRGKEQGSVLKRWLYSMRGLWFLSALFICSATVLIAYKLLNGTGGALIIRILIYVAAWICMLSYDSLNATAFMFPFFLLGTCFSDIAKRIRIQSDDKKILLGGAFFSFSVWIGLFCISDKAKWITRGIGSGAYAVYGKEALASSIYKLVIGVFGVLTVVLISKTFPSLIEKIGDKLRLDKVGRLTMEIYIMQCLIVESFMPTIYEILVNMLGRNPLAENVYIYTCFAVITGWGMLYFISIILGVLKRFPRIKYFLFMR